MSKNKHLIWVLINTFLLGYIIYFMFTKEENTRFEQMISVVFFFSMTIQLFVKYAYKKDSH